MAQKIQTLLIDGSAAEGTVRFGLGGAEYEIDLNPGTPGNYGMRWPGMSMLNHRCPRVAPGHTASR